jgi:hypothetical protein
MWRYSAFGLFGVLVGMGEAMIHFPKSYSFMFPTISVTAGLFILCFTNAILVKK